MNEVDDPKRAPVVEVLRRDAYLHTEATASIMSESANNKRKQATDRVSDAICGDDGGVVYPHDGMTRAIHVGQICGSSGRGIQVIDRTCTR